MEMHWEWFLWLAAAFIAVMSLVKMTTLRKKHLQGLLREYVERQVLWVRRKVKAAEIKSKQADEKNQASS